MYVVCCAYHFTRFPAPVPLDVEFAEPSRFHVRASGEVTVVEIQSAIAGILSHPRMHSGTDVLVDAREVERVPTTPDLRRVARWMKPMVDVGLGAVGIVTENPVIFGVARMFSVFAEAVGASVGAFRDVDEARAWLSEERAAQRG